MHCSLSRLFKSMCSLFSLKFRRNEVMFQLMTKIGQFEKKIKKEKVRNFWFCFRFLDVYA